MDCSIYGQNDRDAYRILTENRNGDWDENYRRSHYTGDCSVAVCCHTRMVNKDKRKIIQAVTETVQAV